MYKLKPCPFCGTPDPSITYLDDQGDVLVQWMMEAANKESESEGREGYASWSEFVDANAYMFIINCDECHGCIMLVQYVEALMELFPSCRAVVFDSSKKMFTREKLIRCRLPMESRFIYYAVNVRLFNIQGAEDMIVDSVGMSMLSLPDIQYHFHGVNPNAVVAHAYQILAYIFASGNPIKSGDSIDGFRGGHMDPSVQWRVQYENAMLPPARKLLDVNMGAYAAGVRE